MTRTERVREHRGANAKIARSANPEATSTDSARASEALGLFVGDTVSCLDRNGRRRNATRCQQVLQCHSK
jgi:hypothetical protein